MSKRNQLFEKSLNLLALEGMETYNARKIVLKAIAEERSHSDGKCMWTNYGTPIGNENSCLEHPIDMCNNKSIKCNPASKFRFDSLFSYEGP